MILAEAGDSVDSEVCMASRALIRRSATTGFNPSVDRFIEESCALISPNFIFVTPVLKPLDFPSTTVVTFVVLVSTSELS